MGVTPNRRDLNLFHVEAWTPVCITTSSDKASLIRAGACRKIGYIHYRGLQFAKREFVFCRASDNFSVDVRFSAKDMNESAKRVEIRIGGRWRELCTVPFYSGNEYAVSLCRSLGYDEGVASGRRMSNSSSAIMRCAPGATAIEECTFTEIREEVCWSFRISCRNFNRDGKIRLVDGWRESEGEVEIYFNRSWGVMCADKWEIDDANVVCRQLGYQNAVSVSAKRRGLHLLSDEAVYYARCKANETWFSYCEKLRNCSVKAEVSCKENECK